jgi:lactoylglutathione lyase
MKYLHTMVRVTDVARSLAFYCDALGLHEVKRYESEQGRFTLIFLAAPGDDDAQVEMTYNWDREEYGIGRATDAWRSCARRIRSRSSCCKEARRHDQPSAARRAWRSCARRIRSRSSCCRRQCAAAQEPWKSMPSVGVW